MTDMTDDALFTAESADITDDALFTAESADITDDALFTAESADMAGTAAGLALEPPDPATAGCRCGPRSPPPCRRRRPRCPGPPGAATAR